MYDHCVFLWEWLGVKGFACFPLVVCWILGLHFFCSFCSDANIMQLGRERPGLPRSKIMHITVAKGFAVYCVFVLFCLFFVLFFLLNFKDPKLLSMAYSAVGKLSR